MPTSKGIFEPVYPHTSAICAVGLLIIELQSDAYPEARTDTVYISLSESPTLSFYPVAENPDEMFLAIEPSGAFRVVSFAEYCDEAAMVDALLGSVDGAYQVPTILLGVSLEQGFNKELADIVPLGSFPFDGEVTGREVRENGS